MGILILTRGFRRKVLFCAILGGGLTGMVSARTHPQAAGLGVTDRLVIASKIYALVQQYFAHWDAAPRPEVEAAYREYIDNAVRAEDRRGFDLATMRFIATLRNGHTQFFDSQLDGRPVKFRLLEVDHEWVVVSSQDGSLPPGTVVRSLDGRSVEDFVRERVQYVAASNDRLARTHVFSYPGLFPERVSVGLLNGNVVIVDRAARAGAVETPTSRMSEGRWLSDGQVAYIRIPAFGDPVYERTAVDLVRRFASSPNLIVDVRGNGGGSTPQQLIGALMNRSWRTWQETTSQAMVGSRQQSPSSDAYGGRLFLLVDRFCGSACEDFVMPFKDTGRAVIIGETTQGSSGNPYRADLGSGMSVAIGAVRYRFPDGSDFEGVGITPDVAIARTVADLVNSRDVVLERARALVGPNGK